MINSIVVSTLIFLINVPLPLILKLVIILYYFFTIIFCVRNLFGFDGDAPKTNFVENNQGLNSLIAWTFVLVFAGSFAVLFFKLSPSLFLTDNIKIATIVLGFMYLLSLYLPLVFSSDVLLFALKNIERDLVLGHTDAATTQGQFDIILLGRTGGHLLQEDVETIVSLLEENYQKKVKIESQLQKIIDAKTSPTDQQRSLQSVRELLKEITAVPAYKVSKSINRLKSHRQLVTDEEAKDMEELSRLYARFEKLKEVDLKYTNIIENQLNEIEYAKQKYIGIKDAPSIIDERS